MSKYALLVAGILAVAIMVYMGFSEQRTQTADAGWCSKSFRTSQQHHEELLTMAAKVIERGGRGGWKGISVNSRGRAKLVLVIFDVVCGENVVVVLKELAPGSERFVFVTNFYRRNGAVAYAKNSLRQWAGDGTMIKYWGKRAKVFKRISRRVLTNGRLRFTVKMLDRAWGTIFLLGLGMHLPCDWYWSGGIRIPPEDGLCIYHHHLRSVGVDS
jgi:hypothetical protein